VYEPEVIDSLDDIPGGGRPPVVKPIGCTVGPGCGCLGLPLALVAGLALSTVFALAWVLRIGRFFGSLVQLGRGRRGGSSGPDRSGTA
jgi:hypothetical protein